ncbi:hypothetical protein WT02_28360 [Burkholderia stagnalis]|nr:hypothetical protein WT02_28360 [Burkholderia stagnalis]KVM07494.1 hypothetical protein WT04_21720 [Burkholderia stagnalis]
MQRIRHVEWFRDRVRIASMLFDSARGIGGPGSASRSSAPTPSDAPSDRSKENGRCDDAAGRPTATKRGRPARRAA